MKSWKSYLLAIPLPGAVFCTLTLAMDDTPSDKLEAMNRAPLRRRKAERRQQIYQRPVGSLLWA